MRDFQGENDINREIAATLSSSDSDKFVILNNGITIICKELRNIVRNRFLLGDYQIVNGCQTSHILYYNKDSIGDNVYVSVKIISTLDEDTVSKIVKATNRQTEVSDEQLMALNDFNKKLEAYYQTYSGTQRLYYERRSKQYANTAEIEKVRVITIPTQIKAFASMFLDKPHLASRYYGRLLKDSQDIFNNDHRPIAYYISAYTLYKVEYLIRNKQIDQRYNRYRYHILMLIKYLALEGKPQPPLNSHKMEELCQKIQTVITNPDELSKYIDKASQIIAAEVKDLSDSENAKTATITERLKGSTLPVTHLDKG
nr:AIPR family protein [Parabacteroides goldsteinii]